jgi:hypothetical protein
MLDQHLASDLVLAPRRDVEVDLQERVGVAVEHGRHAVLDEQRDVLEPVDVLARSRRQQVHIVEERHVLLVGEAPARQVLGVDREDLLGFLAPAHASASPLWLLCT